MTGEKKENFHTWNWSRNFLVDRNKKKIEKKNQRPIPTETKTLPQSLLSQVSTKQMLKPKLWNEKSTQKN